MPFTAQSQNKASQISHIVLTHHLIPLLPASISCPLSCLLECLSPSIVISVKAKLLQSFGFVQHDVFAHHNWELY